eukprot:2183646-Amphidinium_carterae.2
MAWNVVAEHLLLHAVTLYSFMGCTYDNAIEHGESTIYAHHRSESQIDAPTDTSLLNLLECSSFDRQTKFEGWGCGSLTKEPTKVQIPSVPQTTMPSTLYLVVNLVVACALWRTCALLRHVWTLGFSLVYGASARRFFVEGADQGRRAQGDQRSAIDLVDSPSVSFDEIIQRRRPFVPLSGAGKRLCTFDMQCPSKLPRTNDVTPPSHVRVSMQAP